MTSLSWLRPRLAELCGLEKYPVWVGGVQQYVGGRWAPDESVEQAIRCLEAMRKNWDARLDCASEHWSIELHAKHYSYRNAYGKDPSLARCIVLAIAASLNWKEEGETP